MGGISFASIPGTAGKYVADSEGRIYGPRGRLTPGFSASRAVRQRAGKGHRRVSVAYLTGRRHVGVHRAVFAAFNGEPAPGVVVRHLDGDPDNNRVGNLAAGSPADNVADAVQHGTVPSGERHWAAILSDREVRQIREWCALGVPTRQLASDFGVTQRTVQKITRGERRGESL